MSSHLSCGVVVLVSQVVGDATMGCVLGVLVVDNIMPPGEKHGPRFHYDLRVIQPQVSCTDPRLI